MCNMQRQFNGWFSDRVAARAKRGEPQMFDTSMKQVPVNRATVTLTLADGSVTNASVRLPLSNRLAEALNGAEQFLDVVTADGQQMFISKLNVRQVRLLDVPKANQLNSNRRASDRAVFDPYAVLKVDKTASSDEIRQAYLRMSKLYHPDRIATFDLPPEMLDYARAMQVRINLAYEQIGR
jgi:DnaJ-domain-containing protein 1